MNIINSLEKSAEIHPDKCIFKFVDSRKKVVSEYTYAEFNKSVNQLAYYILKNIGTQKRILLVYPSCSEFIRAFYACLKTNNIPIPVYPPNPYCLHKEIKRFSQIVEDSNVKYVLTNQEYNWQTTVKTIQNCIAFLKLDIWPKLTWIVTDSFNLFNLGEKINLNDYNPNLQINPDQIAFIQYTSGSISNPKAVVIRHKNLIHNMNMIKSALDLDSIESGVCVSWLPQYHDMGLIGSVLTTIYGNYTGIYIAPLDFIKDPMIFLELCSEYKCTHIQSPHFIFPLLVRRWHELELFEKPKLNLSSIYHIFNAAQPIIASEYIEFLEIFSQYGLKKEALATGYGLAESTVYVSDTGNNSKRGGKILLVDSEALSNNKVKLVNTNILSAKQLIGCGWPPSQFDVDIRIVSSSNEFLFELEIGEIWVSSHSVGDYLYKSGLIEKEGKKYIRTGDLGFIYNNELFYCGRLKEIIKIRGLTHYPQDIEWSVENVKNIRKGFVAVFDIEEEIYLLVEFKEDKVDLEQIKEIRKNVSLDHGIPIKKIIVLESRTLPKTTSGKLARLKAKNMYLNNQLTSILAIF